MSTLQPGHIVIATTALTTTTTAYTAGDMLSSELTLTGMGFQNGAGGFITGLQVVDKAKIIGGIQMMFFSAASTPATDNNPNSWADADMANLVTSYQLPAPIVSALNGQSVVGNIMLPYDCGAASKDLRLGVITLTGHTFFGGVADLQYTIDFVQWV